MCMTGFEYALRKLSPHDETVESVLPKVRNQISEKKREGASTREASNEILSPFLDQLGKSYELFQSGSSLPLLKDVWALTVELPSVKKYLTSRGTDNAKFDKLVRSNDELSKEVESLKKAMKAVNNRLDETQQTAAKRWKQTLVEDAAEAATKGPTKGSVIPGKGLGRGKPLATAPDAAPAPAAAHVHHGRLRVARHGCEARGGHGNGDELLLAVAAHPQATPNGALAVRPHAAGGGLRRLRPAGACLRRVPRLLEAQQNARQSK